jgi:hypothetical protein
MVTTGGEELLAWCKNEMGFQRCSGSIQGRMKKSKNRQKLKCCSFMRFGRR